MSTVMEKIKYLFCCGFRKQKPDFQDLQKPELSPVEEIVEESDYSSESSGLDDSPKTTIHGDIVIVE